MAPSPFAWPAFLARIEQLIQWRIEVVRQFDLAAHGPRCRQWLGWRPPGHQLRNRHPCAGNHHFLALLHLLQQLEEMGLDLMGVHQCHGGVGRDLIGRLGRLGDDVVSRSGIDEDELVREISPRRRQS
jgi:hypothetical protein